MINMYSPGGENLQAINDSQGLQSEDAVFCFWRQGSVSLATEAFLQMCHAEGSSLIEKAFPQRNITPFDLTAKRLLFLRIRIWGLLFLNACSTCCPSKRVIFKHVWPMHDNCRLHQENNLCHQWGHWIQRKWHMCFCDCVPKREALTSKCPPEILYFQIQQYWRWNNHLSCQTMKTVQWMAYTKHSSRLARERERQWSDETCWENGRNDNGRKYDSEVPALRLWSITSILSDLGIFSFFCTFFSVLLA